MRIQSERTNAVLTYTPVSQLQSYLMPFIKPKVDSVVVEDGVVVAISKCPTT